jgi:Bacteriophage tail sheath protein
MPQYLSPGVYIEEKEAGTRPIEGVATAVAAFVGLAEQGPFNAPTLVTNWTQFTSTFGAFMGGSYLAHAVYGYFLNGGGSAYVVRIGADGKGALPAAKAELMSGADKKLGAYRVQALDGGPAGNDLSVEVQDASAGGDDNFKLVVKRGAEEVETFDNLSTKKGRTNAVTVVNAQSKLIRLEELATGGAVEKVAPGSVRLSGGGGDAAPVRVGPDDYVGNSADRTGFGGLEAIDEVTMVSVPDLSAAYEQGMVDLEGFQAVQLAMIAHCELMANRMAILDPPPGMNPQQIKEWRVDKAGYDSKFAALYWPRVKVFDPLSGQNTFVPPSGHMAGLWARTDGTRGVHKAPANDVVRGAIDIETRITKSEHDVLNPVNINCIRAFPGRGIRVWGARTLSSDPAWRYINVRRLFNFVEQSILGGTQWVVFEPNDQHLWGGIKRTINAFLYRVWLDGALFGRTPDQAFYVKCDEETNPQEVIEAGQVVCEIGIAPVKPAEFVVFRLAQLPAGTSAINE